MVDKLTQERIARNDATFRDANEQIARAAREIDAAEDAPFLCECADPRCTDLLRLTLADYARVRAHPRRFFVVPGHEPAAEGAARVVGGDGRVHIVEKVGHAGVVAERLAGQHDE